MSEAVVEFRPSRVEGVPDVVLVRVSAREVRLISAETERVVRFADIVEQPEGRFVFGIRRRPMCIADRDWFHAPPDRFFRFYTTPPLTISMPVDDAQDWESSCFARIESIIHAEGRFTTADLG